MIRKEKYLLTALLSLVLIPGKAEEKRVNIFDEVVFYDGYQMENIIDKDLDDGVLRFSNSVYSKKLDMKALSDLGENLTMEVTIGALCDNYDRIGDVYLALVPKGSESYEYDAVKRIEISRFITPFMNMNKEPKEVPYEYEINNISRILRDKTLGEQYDFWLEMEVFGIPYAANQQIKGCGGRNDVFDGTIDLVYEPDETSTPSQGNILVPIYVKLPEWKGNLNLNNYNEQATDTIGVTTRTFEFTVPENVNDSRLYLICTDHGAATNGEEYIRRLHLVYLDDEVVLSYTPGGVSCEPYRVYNTQSNGIYSSRRTESFWQNNSNWCPGQAVPIREINTGALTAGVHKVMIRIPDAVFYGKDGDARPSLYFQGVTTGTMPTGILEVWQEGPGVEITRDGNSVRYTSDEEISRVYVHSYDGMLRNIVNYPGGRIDISEYGAGAYILTFMTHEGRTTVKKLII